MRTLDSMCDRVRSALRARFGNHEQLEEESDGAVREEPSSTRSLSTDYTELMGGSVPCPSCKGTGRIPKEMEETLVALIPVNDDRLKPKRTWLYVLVGIAACTLVASVAIFMLVPRAVELIGNKHPINLIHVTAHNSTSTPDQKPFISFHFMNYVNISNWNYYSIQVVNTSALITSRFYPWTDVNSGSGYNATIATIAPLSHQGNMLYFNNTVRLVGNDAEYCQASFSRITSLYVNMQFDVTVAIVYFNHREQVTVSNTQQVCCIPSGNCTSP